MEHASIDLILARLMEATGSNSLSALGPALGISSQAIYDAKKRNKIPDRWLTLASKKYGIAPQEILGGKLRSEHDKQKTSTNKQDNLLNDLEQEKQERRKLSDMVLELTNENRKLWKENSELREKCARLEERMDKPLVSRGTAEMGQLG